MGNSYASLHYHLVFGTKHRRPLIGPAWEARLYGYLGGILRDTGGILLKAGGMPDHIHLVFGHTPARALSGVIRDVKAGSSRWVHEHIEGAADFAWQSGFGLFCVGAANLDQASAYVARQKEHHRTVTFEEEFRALLERAGIQYDPRYMLD
jgi:putative transposase